MKYIKRLLTVILISNVIWSCSYSNGSSRVAKYSEDSLSASMRRYMSYWDNKEPRDNEFFSSFKYYGIDELGYEEGISRRDPSSILYADGQYFVYYTRSQKTAAPVGYDLASKTLPATTWDMCDIYYATSVDGHNWREQGVAVARGKEGAFDDRSVFTPDIMEYNGKFYLYYQAVKYPYKRRSHNVIAMAWSMSPEGPWNKVVEPVLTPGSPGEWDGEEDNRSKIKSFGAFDSHKVHDPNLIVRNGEIWMYYKAHPMGVGSVLKKPYPDFSMGVAIAKTPEGPFVKHPLNPISASGHEALVWPYHEGVATLITANGPEKNTVQWASDGLNFEVKSHVVLPPDAAGLFVKDKYTDTKDGQGFTWGLCHIAQRRNKPWAYIIGFECDLSSTVEDIRYKRENIRFDEEARVNSLRY